MANQYEQNAEYGGLVSGMGQNHPEAYNSEGYNTFDRSCTMLETQRFGEINPVYSGKFIADDIARIRSNHELRTFTLKSPLMSDVFMHRSFFIVPMACLYPNTWSVFYKPQIKGNDFPDAAKPKFPLYYVSGHTNSLKSFISNTDGSETNNSKVHWLNVLFLYIQILSKDGLLPKLGYSIRNMNIDSLVEAFYLSRGLTFSIQRPNGTTEIIDFASYTNLSLVRFYLLQLINNKYTVTAINEDAQDPTAWSDFVNYIRSVLPIYTWQSSDFINLEKLLSYQLVCAQFFTNSYVDDINTAKKWYDNELSIYSTGANAATYRTFTLNGVIYNYDLISNKVMETCLNFSTTATSLVVRQTLLSVLRNLFEVHNSLKTSDYFTDSRTQPLAVGDVYAAVSSNQVSAVDVNKSLWMQRLLNKVNRIPDNINEYIRKMFGSDPISKDPQPMFISSERFRIAGQEVENTSNTNQGNTVTLLRSEQSNFEFECKVSEPSIILGLNSYSVRYVYSTAMDKCFEEFDRYDNFIPELQHLGDQPVLYRELNNDPSSYYYRNTFGYQLRYAQYKSAISHATGGFADNKLPSWAALFENTAAFGTMVFDIDFIRNQNIDFDQFYASLTGKTLTDYFHFITKFDTFVIVNSKQQKFPSLL